MDGALSFEVTSADGSKAATVHAPRTLVDDDTVRAIAVALELPGLSHVRLMPDTHVGHGCVVGYTAHLAKAWWTEGLVPCVIGADIGCGMAMVRLPNSIKLDKDRQREQWEAAITRAVPKGAALHPALDEDEPLTDAMVEAFLEPALLEAQAVANALAKRMPKALAKLKPVYTGAWLRDELCARVEAHFADDVLRSLGTQGGGNHFVEVDELVEVGDHAALRAQEEQRRVDMYEALREWWRSGAIRRPKKKMSDRTGRAKIEATYRAACAKLGVPAALAGLGEEEEEEADSDDEVMAGAGAGAGSGTGSGAGSGSGSGSGSGEADMATIDEEEEEDKGKDKGKDKDKRLGQDEGLPFRLLVAHSGSRHLGHRIAIYHGNAAKAAGGKLVGAAAATYAFDMIVATALAKMNRALILRQVLREVGVDFSLAGVVDNAHNTIDWEAGIVRKGAVPAPTNAPVLIALNMADGVLLCRGLGNADWNDSTAHGCGRSLSRAQAGRRLTMDAFKRAMKDVVSTSVRLETLDEAPQAYKNRCDVQVALAPSVVVQGRYAAIVNVKGW